MTTQQSIRLTYFDFHGGRGEPIRLALFIGGIDFEDRRIAPKDWPALKPDMPFGSMPLLEVDGRRASQSNSILRYVGKLTGLYPSDPWQALLCDEIMDAMEDASHKLIPTLSISDEEEKKAARQALAAGPIPLTLTRLNKLLAERGGQHFADNRLTVADLKAFTWIRHLRSGRLDYIPGALADEHGPLLVDLQKRVNTHEKVVAYYEKVGGY